MANRETANPGIVSNGCTSLNITSIIDQVSERNKVVVSEGRDGRSNRKSESIAGGFIVGAEMSIGRSCDNWRRRRRAENSVDLVGDNNVSKNDVSYDGSSGLVQVSIGSQDVSFRLVVGINGSSSSREVIKEV